MKNMQKKYWVLTAFLLLVNSLFAQKFYTKSGNVSFKANTILEEVAASTNSVIALYNVSNKEVQIEIFIKGFEFKKALMQEHFNENYMESDKFPKATFKGVISTGNYELSKIGSQKVSVKGNLTIHGVTKPVEVSGTITTTNGFPQLNATFNVKPSDYNIKIPSLVKDKIASIVEVTFNSLLNNTLK